MKLLIADIPALEVSADRVEWIVMGEAAMTVAANMQTAEVVMGDTESVAAEKVMVVQEQMLH